MPKTGDLYQAIISIFETMPAAKAGLVLLAITMIAFYATSFDALTMVPVHTPISPWAPRKSLLTSR